MKEKWISKRDIFKIAIIISGGFFTFCCQTMVSPALPSIMREFSVDTATAQWLTTAFLMVNGIMVPVTAFLISRFSTRALFMSSMGVFCLGTAVAALAPTFWVLLLGRIMQAMGAGIQFPLGTVCMMLIFPKKKRGLAMGIVGVVINFAPALGPVYCGFMIDQWSWRVAFLSMLPLILADIIFAAFLLENVGETSRPRFDWLSVILSTVSFGGMLFGFSYAGSYGWLQAETLLSLAAGGICFVFFVRRQVHDNDEPFLRLALLKNRVLSCSVTVIMIVNASLMIGTLITPIFIQDVLGYSALYSALALVPGAIVMCVLSPIGGILFDRIGARVLAIIGMSSMVAASVMLSIMSEYTPYWYVIFAYCLRSVGIVLVNMPVNTWGLNSLDNHDIAHGNAISNTGRQVAGSLGTAILVTVMSMVMSFSPATYSAVHALALGIDAAFAGAGVLCVAGLIIVLARVGR